jgi:anti-sigma B factor antagonist
MSHGGRYGGPDFVAANCDQASFRVEDLHGCAVVVACGEIDLYTAPRLREVLLVAVTSSAHRVVVDLSAVTFVDPIGLGTLASASKRTRTAHGSVCLVVGPSVAIRRILEVTRLTDLFEIHATLAEAVTEATVGDPPGTVA